MDFYSSRFIFIRPEDDPVFKYKSRSFQRGISKNDPELLSSSSSSESPDNTEDELEYSSESDLNNQNNRCCLCGSIKGVLLCIKCNKYFCNGPVYNSSNCQVIEHIRMSRHYQFKINDEYIKCSCCGDDNIYNLRYSHLADKLLCHSCFEHQKEEMSIEEINSFINSFVDEGRIDLLIFGRQNSNTAISKKAISAIDNNAYGEMGLLVRDRYDNFRDYYTTYKRLYDMELSCHNPITEICLKRYEQPNKFVIHRTRESGYELHIKTDSMEQNLYINSFIICCFEGNYHPFEKEDINSLVYNKKAKRKFDSSELVLTGRVVNFTSRLIIISLCEEYFKDIEKVKQVFDERIFNSFNILRCYIIDPKTQNFNTQQYTNGDLLNLHETTFIQSLLGNLHFPNWNLFEENDIIFEITETQNLNPQQKKAVLNSLNSQISVVFGPPGTGKTTVIKSMVVNFIQLEREHRISDMDEKIFGMKHKSLNNPKVLCVAQNNNAVNVLAGKLRSPGLKICRFISFERLEEMPFDQWDLCIYARTLEYALQDEERFREYRLRPDDSPFNLIKLLLELKEATRNRTVIKYSRRKMGNIHNAIKKEFKGIIEDCNVIVATVKSCLKNTFNDINFLCTFIDEATQCTEYDCLFPALRSPRLVLLGDIQQLKPVILSDEAKKAGFDISMFERLLHCKVRRTLLNEQYRMHPGISILPNTLFYNRKIIDGTRFERSNISIFPNKKVPIVFICHTGKERYCNDGSLFNDTEAEICKEVYLFLRNEAKIKIKDIEFLTPYNSQKVYAKDYCQIERASSIDSFQGNETDYVIFSPVRSNYVKGAKFIGDFHRVNVAITRAKKGLIIVGNDNTLKNETVWRLIFNFLARNGCFMKYVNTTENHFIPINYPIIQSNKYEQSPYHTDYLNDN
ncbi:Hypothetical protein KM1_148850 [Entamoeba histolytica HM-3:IMSS]|uniref:Upf1 domain-containing protein n=1 Tax=Entamoeba histolytica HM-3:IMSS TaxID=885315 RepID=M7WCA3_ENTHI|nr:Hypothetical protein KM1_148850 [Entamoeba histolytica HM-3:IMSS]